MAPSLPPNPSLTQLRKQAKDLHKAHKAGDPSCCEVLRRLNRFTEAADADILAADIPLKQVQFALAMDYGFASWAELKELLVDDDTWQDLFSPEELGRWAPKVPVIVDGVFDSVGLEGRTGHEQQYGDFVLECEFLFVEPGEGHGGITLRTDRDTDIKYLNGYEIDIDGAANDMGHVHFPCYPQPYTGEIRFQRGQWQRLRVMARGNTITTSVDGVGSLQFSDDRFRYGQICLAGCSLGMKYRGLRIRSLDSKPPQGPRSSWAPLFNGEVAEKWRTVVGIVRQAGGGPIMMGAEPGEPAAVAWQGRPLSTHETLEFDASRRGDDPDGHYDFILLCDADNPFDTGIRFECFPGGVKAFGPPQDGKPAALLGSREFPVTPWGEIWRFVVAGETIRCYRSGEELLTVESPGLTPGSIAIATHVNSLEIRKVDRRAK